MGVAALDLRCVGVLVVQASARDVVKSRGVREDVADYSSHDSIAVRSNDSLIGARRREGRGGRSYSSRLWTQKIAELAWFPGEPTQFASGCIRKTAIKSRDDRVGDSVRALRDATKHVKR